MPVRFIGPAKSFISPGRVPPVDVGPYFYQVPTMKPPMKISVAFHQEHSYLVFVKTIFTGSVVRDQESATFFWVSRASTSNDF